MKIRKMWVSNIAFFIFMLLLDSYVLYLIPSIPGSPDFPGLNIVCCIIAILGFLVFSIVLCNECITGLKYIQIEQIPFKEFGLDIYENLIIVTHRGKAFPIKNYNKNNLLKTKTVKVTKYFNSKKEEKGWDVNLPYMRGN